MMERVGPVPPNASASDNSKNNKTIITNLASGAAHVERKMLLSGHGVRVSVILSSVGQLS